MEKMVMLKSKLKVYEVCYQQAEKQNDQKKMDKIEPYIEELQKTIDNLN